MKGYSKIRFVNTHKSRSIDFSDLYSPPQTPKTIPNHSLSPTSKTQETKQIDHINTNTQEYSLPQQENEDGVGERFGVILSRNCSVSSNSSQRFRLEKKSPTLQSAVKRAFSMRRSSSVSEGYSRIHDQSEPLASSPIADEDVNTAMQSRSKKKKRGKILKTCKRLFGF